MNDKIPMGTLGPYKDKKGNDIYVNAERKDSLGDRIKKNYEYSARHFLTRRTPVIVRVDGKAFHTLTKGMHPPFDQVLVNAMVNAAHHTAMEMQGFKLAYVQSDEVSFLLTDYDNLNTNAWFSNNQAKIESITASIMTAAFNKCLGGYGLMPDELAYFDARAFNIPETEVANYFLWRAKDWERNSLSMYACEFFTQRELHGRKRAAVHEMLHAKGKNWAEDLSEQLKNGTWIANIGLGFLVDHELEPVWTDINALVEGTLACPELGDH